MSPDEEAILRAICACPDDDAPRLVYADWLDEQADPASAARAEFIRVQIRLASVPGYDRIARTLEQRAWRLLHDHNPAWLGPMGMKLWGVRYRRGFLEDARTRSDLLLEYGPWFALQPIRCLDCEADKEIAVELRRALRGRRLVGTGPHDSERLQEFNALPHAVQRERLAAAGGRLAAMAGLEAFTRLRSFRWAIPSHPYPRRV